MTLAEIKAAVDAGRVVHWSNHAYRVIRDKHGRYLIDYRDGQSTIGLTWVDGVTLNGDEGQFFACDE